MTSTEKDLSYLSDKINKGPLSHSQAKDLEKLLEIFGSKFNIISIEGDYVYGYMNNKKKYLGTKAEYYKYKILKKKKIKQKNKAKDGEEEKARENFIKSYKNTE